MERELDIFVETTNEDNTKTIKKTNQRLSDSGRVKLQAKYRLGNQNSRPKGERWGEKEKEKEKPDEIQVVWEGPPGRSNNHRRREERKRSVDDTVKESEVNPIGCPKCDMTFSHIEIVKMHLDGKQCEGRPKDRSDRKKRYTPTSARSKEEDCERKSNADEVEMLTKGEIRKTLQKRYPEVPERTYDTLIDPDKSPDKGRHMKFALEMMKEMNRTDNKELCQLLLALSSGHLNAHDLIRDGTEKGNSLPKNSRN